MPSLFRFLSFVGLIGGLGLCHGVRARQFRQIQAARDHRDRPPTSSSSSRTDGSITAQGVMAAQASQLRRQRWSNCSSTCRRPSAAPAKTRSPPIATTSPTSPRICAAAAAALPMPAPTTCADFSPASPSAASRRPRWRGGCRRCASSIRFLYAEGKRADDPAAVLEGPKRGRSLPKVLSIAEVDRLLTQARADAEDGKLSAAAAPARGAAVVPAGSRLRHRLARLRAGGAAGLRRAPRPKNARGPRQRRQGTAGAAQQGGQARHGGISRAARRRRKQDAVEMAVPLLWRAGPSHPPAFRPRT